MRLISGGILLTLVVAVTGCSKPPEGDPNPPAVAVSPAPVSNVGTAPADPVVPPATTTTGNNAVTVPGATPSDIEKKTGP